MAHQSHQARECGRQFFVVRAFIIIEVGSIAVAHFAGWLINHPSYLGLRARALYRPETWWTGVRRHGGHLSIISLSLSEVKRSNFLMKKKDFEDALSSSLAKHDVESTKSFAHVSFPVFELDHADRIHLAHDLAERIFDRRQSFGESPNARLIT